MIDEDVLDLINELKTQASSSVLEKLVLLVGTSSQLSDLLLEHLGSMEPAPEHLELCELLLIDDAKKAIPVARRVLAAFPDSVSAFANNLLASPFYALRQAVPRIILNLECGDSRDILKTCLGDPIVSVVRNAVAVLAECFPLPFSDDELVDIARQLSTHHSEYIQCLVPDIVVLIKQPTSFVSEICASRFWRRRYAVASKASLLNESDRAVVYSHLSQDEEEEIRACLAKNMDCMDDWTELAPQFLRDDSPAVRALAVQAVGGREGFQEMLKEIVSDASWEVRKKLLAVQKSETYRNIAIPLINSLNSASSWRTRMEVLKSIAQVSRRNEDLLRESLCRHLLNYLHDEIHEIRMETSRILEDLIPMYPWTAEWLPEIESAVSSKNYLHRITAANAALAFDRTYRTEFTKTLLGDAVDNVRLYVLSIIDMKGVGEDIREMVGRLCESRDEELQRAAAALLDAGHS